MQNAEWLTQPCYIGGFNLTHLLLILSCTYLQPTLAIGSHKTRVANWWTEMLALNRRHATTEWSGEVGALKRTENFYLPTIKVDEGGRKERKLKEGRGLFSSPFRPPQFWIFFLVRLSSEVPWEDKFKFLSNLPAIVQLRIILHSEKEGRGKVWRYCLKWL